ncbi:ABC transporter ATP-binding protein [Myxococcota bacterium]|nr:ABC transporter ATP-binding protein [Myxococcota bacterium]MBU1382951.1 ABC transporter ATP-binding protein [Myxococcota bacterium]MBU1495477.1 ABC transporter ATP-binding protein [Myxococcota bacterium]
MDIISLEKIEKTYIQGKLEVKALRGIDLNIGTGEFTAICGPSGSGKTTLLNIIGCLDNPTSGKALVTGKDISTLNATQLSNLRLHRIGFVFQAYNLVPVLTAYENVDLVLSLQGRPKNERTERVIKVLKEVGLSDLASRRPAEMSGGQQQRVAVARALVAEPSLILADEPTANLDSQTGKSLLKLMRQLNEEHGVTFLFSTHDSMVMDFSRRIVRIVDGTVAEDYVKDSRGESIETTSINQQV